MEKKTEDIIKTVQKNAQTDDERKWCVYCHTNKANGKKYFGITSLTLKDRWRDGRGYRTSSVFWRAIQKYGWDGFVHEVIADNLTEKEAKNKEIELIALYKTNCSKYQKPSYGYNLTDGGDGVTGVRPWNYGIPMTAEQKEKIIKANTGRVFTEEHIKKLSDAKKGKRPSNYDMLRTEEVLKKNAEARRGKHHSDETKKKISDVKKGKHTGIDSSRFRPVYCVELNELFWGAKEAQNKYGFSSSNIGECCRGQRNYAYRHPTTNDRLHWMYAIDAIEYEYITQKDLSDYLEQLKKGNDI